VSFEASTVLANIGALPGAADKWASFVPPFDPKLSVPLDGANPSIGAQDAASQAVVTATADWPNSYNARYNQREALAKQFVAACGGAAQIFSQADEGGGTQVASAAPSGPILA
jgi:hypothetical protein